MVHKLKVFLTRIQTKLLLSFLILIMIPILIAVMLYYESSNRLLMTEVHQSSAEMLAKLADRVNTTAERMYQASHLMINDPEMIEFLQLPDKSWLVEYDTFQKYKAFSKKMINIRDFLLETEAYVAVFDFRGHLTSTWTMQQSNQIYEQMQLEPWFEATKAMQGVPLWNIFNEQDMSIVQGSKTETYLTMTRLVAGSTGKGYGIVLIAVPISSMLPEMIAELPAEEGTGIKLFLVKDQELLLGNKGAYAALDQRFLINEQHINQLGWSLIEATPSNLFSEKLQSLRNQSMFWLVLLLVCCCFIFIMIMLRIMKRLKMLHSSMSKVGIGNFTPIPIGAGDDELVLLSRKFNDMVSNLSVLVKNVAEEQKKKEEAKFQALQAQVKPHFLFNTLTSIKWSAKLSGAEHVSEMITSLGKLLSYSMKNDKEQALLSEEIDFLSSYVSLQNLRFNNSVRLEVDLSSELLAVPILKFTLQPIVENSIIHGRNDPLLISIHGGIKDGIVTISIRDNGGGSLSAGDGTGENSVEHHASITVSKFSGIGLKNIHERIKLHFGVAYGLTVRNIKNEGFEVTLQLPLQRGEQ
ncbi:sensor histidine kinase [Paenibacillus paeoniae]|nr:histidine kinase [Paenibacillus paeoniae]